MRTIEYSWYHPPFPEYNEAQSSVIPFLDKDVNLVVSFSTAVGKTVLAECAFAYHLAQNTSSRVAYICPFRSLASEKFETWKNDPQLGKYGVVLWSSESEDDGRDGEGRLVVSTLESFDMKSRSGYWADWIKSFDCVVFDEAHIIGDKDRGGAMESSILRLTEIGSSRIIFLSATMGNSTELAKWVKSLNRKTTKCITSGWRPTQIHIEYHVVDGYDEKVDSSVELAIASACQKTLVFVHSKVTGVQIVKKIREKGERAAFHNASLSSGKRRKLEEAFVDQMSGLNILVSTSTLGAGVNLILPFIMCVCGFLG